MSKQRRKKKKRLMRWIVLSTLLVLSAFVGGKIGYMKYQLVSSIKQGDGSFQEMGVDASTVYDKDIINILLIGADSREEWNDSGRSDSTMIATLDLKHGQLKLTSLMRDMYIDIPGHEKNRFNAAYKFGGVALLNETIAQNFNVRLDGYVIVDFKAFRDVIDELGGVQIPLTELEAQYLNRAYHGKITVGSMDISKVEPETLMSLYSIVFQDVTLFNNTILENIRIGKKDASDAEVIAAAKLANCEEFAKKLPDGWNSMIGENGCELSGGERQRISIARAFLKDAPIILLDEATASLDVENETLIQSALSRLIKNKTVLVIAHRMRTVAGADKIVVLSDGLVAEQGTPEELYKKKGLYSRMVKLQTKGQNWTLS